MHRGRRRPKNWRERAAGTESPEKRRQRRGKRLLLFVLILPLLSVCISGSIAWSYFDSQAAQYDLDRIGNMPQRSIVYDSNGEVIGRLHGDNRIITSLDKVSPFLKDALIAREDARFYDHGGVDYVGVGRAMLRNAKEGEIVQGASTLTMQLARNSFDLREKSFERKMVEALLARRIERKFRKDQILFFYLNRIYFGSGLYGIERAAQAYFGKSAADLNLPESAMIAGIIRAPNRFSPFRHADDAIRERDATLDRMLEEGFITEAEAAAAKAHPTQALPQEPVHEWMPEENYVLNAVRHDLDLLLAEREIEDGGLLIYTTFDTKLQHAVEDAVERRLVALERAPNYPHPRLSDFAPGDDPDHLPTPEYLQAAVIVIENETGAIRAMLGGRNFAHSRFNRATQSNRQIGSLFKPIAYTAAFERGLFPGTLISDQPILPQEIPWYNREWSPKNSDLTFHDEWMPAEYGLIRSRNTMSVRVGEVAGIDFVLDAANHAGLGPLEERNPQIYIGNLGASLKAVTSSYSVFANEGYRHRPFMIRKIVSTSGRPIYDNLNVGYQVFSPASTYLTRNILEKAMEPGGTGAGARSMGFHQPAGGKTGTTNNYEDAWFAGFTSKLSCGVWVGLDQPERIVDRGYGSRLALPIWTDTMLSAEKLGYAPGPFNEPTSLREVELCNLSGCFATDECRQSGHAYLARIPTELIPRENCQSHEEWYRQTQAVPGHPVTKRDGFFKRLIGVFDE